tara:strand:- start:4315 stop:4674 length:360 start_codon:yes stop_codon:yes gene_type:complete
MRIKSFIINTNKKSITINLSNGDTACLGFEYLRVFTPKSNDSAKQQVLASHKKLVMLSAIENVGKHGYRFIFDDQHSAIYSTEYLNLLIIEHEQRWQYYLTELKASGHSREAIINITQL